MNIVIFTHPDFFNSISMKKYAGLLADGLRSRNHSVEIFTPTAIFHEIPLSGNLKKWFGYIDSFLIFPLLIRGKLKNLLPNTLFVFPDQALGPWVYLVNKKPQVIHCHDFLALEFSKNGNHEIKGSWTGRQYQKIIQKGFSKGRNFISISKKTKKDLHRYHLNKPVTSYVVYNQISPEFRSMNKRIALENVKCYFKTTASSTLELGYILHVGANVWYKNKRGVLEIYHSWRVKYGLRKPLLMVGEPDAELKNFIKNKFWKDDIFIMKNISDSLLRSVYNAASVFLFPSLAEGFGWPIAEAMACKCAVITTNEAPMTEVGGPAAFYIPKRPGNQKEISSWANFCAGTLQEILSKKPEELELILNTGITQVEKFESSKFLDQIEIIYQQVLENESNYQFVN